MRGHKALTGDNETLKITTFHDNLTPIERKRTIGSYLLSANRMLLSQYFYIYNRGEI